MLQRVQTIYLLIAALILGCFVIFPIAVLVDDKLKVTDLELLKTVYDKDFIFLNYIIVIKFITWLIIMLILVTIILFKKRNAQMALCFLNIILLVVLVVATFFILYHNSSVSGYKIYYKMPVVFPVISSLFIFLAYKGIRKDELLVKSYDRLR